jgi:hypothetical protein
MKRIGFLPEADVADHAASPERRTAAARADIFPPRHRTAAPTPPQPKKEARKPPSTWSWKSGNRFSGETTFPKKKGGSKASLE